jgi:predicted ATPase/DNA-binding SARP family transcriptional activator
VLFRVLGSLQVDGDGEVRRPSGARGRALFAALVLGNGRAVPIDRLAQHVWGEDPPEHLEGALHTVVARLRRALGPGGAAIRTRSPGYLLDLTGAALDTDVFERDCRDARALSGDDPLAAVRLFDRALALWTGPPYAEFAESFARPAAARLVELRLAAQLDRAEALLAAGAADDAVAAARDVTTADPLAARPVGVLMRALAAAGRTVDALEAYRRHAGELATELGLDPPPELRELHTRILREDVDRPRPAPVAVPLRLRPLTGFVGRAAERAGLAAQLAAHRMVTVVGPGGVGKTRLAVVVTEDVADRFPDGVVAVDLVPVVDDASVPAAVAAAAGVAERPGGSATQAVLGRFADRRALLVMDNCEHVLDGAAELVERLLAAAPRTAVLATSRARLMVPVERAFPLSGLVTADAVALFVERAAASGAAVAADARTERICTDLDGIALAIELAAARLPALGLDGIEAGLRDRVEMLAGSRRVDARHRSVRSALDWSHALLDDRARAVLRRLSVFAGPVDADTAAEVIARPPLTRRGLAADLARLADHSLLVAVPTPGGTRYRALETVRQYGSQLLADHDELDDYLLAHLDWCRDRARALLAGAPSPRFDDVADELRAAVMRAAGDVHDLAADLATLCHHEGLPEEAQRWYRHAAELAPTAELAYRDLRRAAGTASTRLAGDDAVALHQAAARAALEAGLPVPAGYEYAKAGELLNRMPGMLSLRSQPRTAGVLLREARRHAGDDPATLARIAVATAFGDAEHRPAAAAEARRLAEESGDPLARSAALDALTFARMEAGDYRGAFGAAGERSALLAGVPVDAETSSEHADAADILADTALAAGDLAVARRAAEAIRALPVHRGVGHLAAARLLQVCTLAGDLDEAAELAEVFHEGWVRSGRPGIGNLRPAAAAAAAACGLRGDEERRRDWLAVADRLAHDARSSSGARCAEVFDALYLLHHGRAGEAVRRLGHSPADPAAFGWLDTLWRPWYAALWAEAAVLADDPAAADRIGVARAATGGNAVAAVLVERAAAVLRGDRKGVLAASEALAAAGCRYQQARSLLLADGGR